MSQTLTDVLSAPDPRYTRANLIVWKVVVQQGDLSILTYAMTDSGAEGIGFMDRKWAETLNLTAKPLPRPVPVSGFHGEEVEDGTVTHYVEADLAMGDHHQKKALFYVTRLSRYPIILGLAWLAVHDLNIRFSDRTAVFDSEYCRRHCNTPHQPTRIRALQDVPLRGRCHGTNSYVRGVRTWSALRLRGANR